MENLPSPPQQLPARRPQSQTVSLSCTQRALQTWPQGWTAGARLASGPDAHLVWARGGAEQVQELRLLEWGGALEKPGSQPLAAEGASEVGPRPPASW
jgi:hypothetical protein